MSVLPISLRVAARFAAQKPMPRFLAGYFAQLSKAKHAEISRYAESLPDWSTAEDLLRQNPGAGDEAILAKELRGFELDWTRFIDEGLFLKHVVIVLEQVSPDIGLSDIDVRLERGGLTLQAKAYGTSYSINPDDPNDYVEAPASGDDFSNDIARALKIAGATSTQVTTGIENSEYSDQQNVVFGIRAVWNVEVYNAQLSQQYAAEAYTKGLKRALEKARRENPL